MGSRNITLSLPEELIRSAKAYAAEHDTSINTLVRELLSEAVSRRTKARKAADRLLALADRGTWSMVDPGEISRDELRERD